MIVRVSRGWDDGVLCSLPSGGFNSDFPRVSIFRIVDCLDMAERSVHVLRWATQQGTPPKRHEHIWRYLDHLSRRLYHWALVYHMTAVKYFSALTLWLISSKEQPRSTNEPSGVEILDCCFHQRLWWSRVCESARRPWSIIWFQYGNMIPGRPVSVAALVCLYKRKYTIRSPPSCCAYSQHGAGPARLSTLTQICWNSRGRRARGEKFTFVALPRNEWIGANAWGASGNRGELGKTKVR